MNRIHFWKRFYLLAKANRTTLLSLSAALIASILGACLVYFAALRMDRARIEKLLQSYVAGSAQSFELRFQGHIEALFRMGSRLSLQPGMPLIPWQNDAINYLKSIPLLEFIAIAGEDNNILHIVPDNFSNYISRPFSSAKDSRQLRKQMALQGLGISSASKLPGNKTGILLIVPAGKHILIAGMPFEKFAEQIAGKAEKSGFAGVVFSPSGKALNPAPAGAASLVQSQSRMDLGGQNWQLAGFATKSFYRQHKSWQPEISALIALVLLLLASGLMVAITYAGHKRKIAEKSAADLIQSNKELQMFTYAISHDLRAPLRHCSGFVELLREEISKSHDSQADRYMDAIFQSARRMNELIEALLEFARLGQQPLKKVSCDFNELLQSVLSEINGRKQEVQWEIAGLPVLHVDRTLIRQVLSNLLDNALKYTANKKQPKIEIFYKEKDNYCVICIKDNGAGFNMQLRDRLFGLFQRLHSEEEFAGYGIGLAFARRIVERHGGTICAESSPGQGARFEIHLPALEKQE